MRRGDAPHRTDNHVCAALEGGMKTQPLPSELVAPAVEYHEFHIRRSVPHGFAPKACLGRRMFLGVFMSAVLSNRARREDFLSHKPRISGARLLQIVDHRRI